MKVFTMVKGEVDIVSDWVLYHGELVGFENVHVIDNFSKDGTYEVLKCLQKRYPIHVHRARDYAQKGRFMTHLLRKHGGPHELVFPIDIDEFLVLFHEHTRAISCDPDEITGYLRTLPPAPFYKMNYLNAKTLTPHGYQRATVEATRATHVDYGGQAKTFFNATLFRGNIDHGNHYVVAHSPFPVSALCLVHFHQRNLPQMKKKVFNNVRGFAYPVANLDRLKQLIAQHGTNLPGFHHVLHQIDLLQHRFALTVEAPDDERDVSLAPLNQRLLQLDLVYGKI